MSSARSVRSFWLGLAILALGTGPVLAHGCNLMLPPPLPSAPPAQAGSNTPEPPAPDPFNGPVGGGELRPPPLPDVPAPAAGPAPAPPVSRATAAGTASASGSLAQSGGRGARGYRPKVAKAAWMDRLDTSWKGVFPVTQGPEGYEQGLGALAEGLRRPATSGGWARKPVPSLILVLDSANEKHQAALERLDADTRFSAAARLFNCFKVDTRGGKPAAEMRLSVHFADGTLSGEARGEREIRKSFDLLAEAWRKDKASDLTKLVPRVAHLAGAMAYYEHHQERMEAALVCPDCGLERYDALEKAAEMKLRRDGCVAELESLRK